MGWIGRIIVGGLLVFVGYLFVRHATWFVYNVMRIPWAEKWLRSSHNFYRLFGIILIFIGMLVMTNLWDSFLMATLGRLLGANK